MQRILDYNGAITIQETYRSFQLRRHGQLHKVEVEIATAQQARGARRAKREIKSKEPHKTILSFRRTAEGVTSSVRQKFNLILEKLYLFGFHHHYLARVTSRTLAARPKPPRRPPRHCQRNTAACPNEPKRRRYARMCTD